MQLGASVYVLKFSINLSCFIQEDEKHYGEGATKKNKTQIKLRQGFKKDSFLFAML